MKQLHSQKKNVEMTWTLALSQMIEVGNPSQMYLFVFFSPGSYFLGATSSPLGGSYSTNLFGVWDVKKQVTNGQIACFEYSNPRIILSKDGTTVSVRSEGMH